MYLNTFRALGRSFYLLRLPGTRYSKVPSKVYLMENLNHSSLKYFSNDWTVEG
jgi:hypothetical protein